MASVSDFYGGSYLTASDVKKPVIVTIETVDFEVIQNTQKIVIQFSESDLRYVLNKSNAKTIAAEYGDDTDGWGGSKIQLSPGLTEYNGNQVPCIVVSIPSKQAIPNRPRVSGANVQRKPAPAPPPESEDDTDPFAE